MLLELHVPHHALDAVAAPGWEVSIQPDARCIDSIKIKQSFHKQKYVFQPEYHVSMANTTCKLLHRFRKMKATRSRW